VEALNRRIRKLETERDILKKHRGHFQPTDLRKVYSFIKSHTDSWPVHTLCLVLRVSRSAYNRWLTAGEKVDKREEETGRVIQQTFQEHRRRYGVRLLVAELQDKGLEIGAYKVRLVLQKYGLKAIRLHSFVPRTTDSHHPYPISPNLLLDFAFSTVPNQVWVGDITYIPMAGGGFLYLALWMDGPADLRKHRVHTQEESWSGN